MDEARLVARRPRILSLSPGARDVLQAIGAGDALVAAGEMSVAAGLDPERLARLAPTLVFVDDPDGDGAARAVVRRATAHLRPRPHVYALAPKTVGDVLSAIKTVGDAAGAPAPARELIEGLKARIDRVSLRTAGAATIPRVVCLDLLDPPRVAGRWLPELIGLAGGYDVLGGAGWPSRAVGWDQIVARHPDIVVLLVPTEAVGPARTGEARPARVPWPWDHPDEHADRPEAPVGWDDVPAQRAGRVSALDAEPFLRPGPGVADALEMLARVLQPDLFGGRWAPIW